jgi:hypothetical protein
MTKHGFSLAHQPKEFRSAVRRFEQGLFEIAGEQVMAILKDNPHHLPSLRLLRLIERRLWPKPYQAPVLVWQFPPEKAFERDWLRMLLGDSIVGEHVDNAWSYLAPSMIVVDNKLVAEKVPYYRRAFENGCRVVLIHLSDEAFADDRGAYDFCEAVVRNYRSDVLAENARVMFLPLGFKAGFANAAAVKPATHRKHLWSFAGDPNKLTRGEMLKALAEIGQGVTHLTSGFDASDSLPTAAYRALLDETVVVPCPCGWSNLESFRVYEALEAGCIPIVEKRKGFDFFTALLGPHPMPTVLDWREGAARVRQIKERGEADTLQRACMDWWAAYKPRLATQLRGFVKNAFENDQGLWPRTYPP